jgi:hypothetical protein
MKTRVTDLTALARLIALTLLIGVGGGVGRGLQAAQAIPENDSLPPSSSQSTSINAFSVTLAVTYRGIRAGKSELTLEALEDGHWRYSSTNRARGLFRLVFPDDIQQFSELQISSEGIRPLRYVADDGSNDTSRDITLIFDWIQRKVRGVAEQESVEIDLGLEDPQDPMSVQLALIWALKQGKTPDHFWLIDKRQLKRYLYRSEGTQSITVAGKVLQAEIWSSRREGSDRVTRVWHSPELGFIPVRAERRRADRVEWTMQAEHYALNEASAAVQVRGKVTPR